MPRARHQPAIHPFDILHGTDTSGLLSGTEIAEGTDADPVELTAYYGIAPSILRSLIALWLTHSTALDPPRLIERTIFLDVGAGTGRAMLIASELPFLRVEGIELNADLARIGRDNINRWQRDPDAEPLAPLVLHHGDATSFALPQHATLAFLFHPFELTILRRFLRHVERSLTLHPRPFDLLYANAEHEAYLDRHPAFTRLWSGPVAMTPEDHRADLAAIAGQNEYGSTGDELCAIYRYAGRQPPRRSG